MTGDLLIYWLISTTPGWSVFVFVVIFTFVLIFVFVLSVAGVTGRFADLWVDCYLEVGDLGSWGGVLPSADCCLRGAGSRWWPQKFHIAAQILIC